MAYRLRACQYILLVTLFNDGVKVLAPGSAGIVFQYFLHAVFIPHPRHQHRDKQESRKTRSCGWRTQVDFHDNGVLYVGMVL